MQKNKPSLYVILGLIVVITALAVMGLFAMHDYTSTKNAFIKGIQEDSRLSVVALEGNIADLMAAYAVNDYEQLVQTEIERNNNFAIIVEDFNMGEMLGEEAFLSGRIRGANWNIVEYDPENQEQNKQLKAVYYSDKKNIVGSMGETLGTITVYTSDRLLNVALNQIVRDTLAEALISTLLLIVILIFAIKRYVLKPLSDIVTVIARSDADGVPVGEIPEHNSKEISVLTLSMNTMITAIQQSRVELHQQHKELVLSSRVFSDTHEGIVITDGNNKIVDVNPAFTEIVGYSREEVLGKDPGFLSSGKQSPEFYQDMWQRINSQGYWQGELWNRKKCGDSYAELISISVLKNDDGAVSNYVSIFSDITSSKKQQERLSFMAHYDVLTGLPNRALFTDRFHQAIAHSKRTGHQLAVCFLDLDSFKPVNDQYGHEVGDRLLIEVAKRITEILREEDTVSRQGGDEFTLLLNDIESFEQCMQTLDRVHYALAEPFIIDDFPHKITASSGVTLYPADDGDVDTLLRHADQAMYEAKFAGKNRYHLFNPELDRRAVEKRQQIERIDQALVNNEFSLYYQPKVNMVTGDVYGAEALIRWLDPEKGLIPPLDFLPLIEESELDIKVGAWVINQAVQQLEMWIGLGISLELSINISPHHLLSNNFLEQLESALNQHPSVDPCCLQLEILESSALGDLNVINNIIKACQNTLGVNIALDDFGTGYSSLTHLRNLAANTIKIDQSFVRDVLDDPSDYAIIDGIIGLADAFDRDIIAEGVETTNHGLMLILMGCKKVQGYGIAKPMPASNFPQWLENYEPNEEWMLYGAKQLSIQENKVMLFALITSHWKERFIDNIQSDPEDIEHWPIMNSQHCACGTWLAREKSERLVDAECSNQLEQAHERSHIIANTLLLKYQQGEYAAAKEGLNELQLAFHEMSEALGCRL